MLGVKSRQKSEKSRKKNQKRQKENNVKIQRRHLSKIEEVHNGNHVLCEKDKKEMIRKHDLEAIRYINAISQMKMKIHNGVLK